VIVVADASVAVKWFLAGSPAEEHTDQALAIFDLAVRGELQLIQPAHFVAEMAAVLARVKPEQAQDDLLDLLDIECRTGESPEIYATAVDLATRLRHHLFDTLYHAVALHTPGAMLVTADRRYYAKAGDLGHIAWLGDFQAA